MPIGCSMALTFIVISKIILFGDGVRSKCDTAMKNEVLSKILAYNLCVLLQEQQELGIEPIFWQNEADNNQPRDVLRIPSR